MGLGRERGREQCQAPQCWPGWGACTPSGDQWAGVARAETQFKPKSIPPSRVPQRLGFLVMKWGHTYLAAL